MITDVNEMFECVGEKDIDCSTMGCIIYNPEEKGFAICEFFKLKKEYAMYKNDSKNEVV